MADGHAVRLDDEAGHDLTAALGQHVVEQDGIEPPEQQIAVRVHVVVVRNGGQAVVAFGAQQDLVGDRPAEGADATAGEIGKSAIPTCVGVAHGKHFAEFVVGNRRRERGSAAGRVFDAAQADVGVAARDRLIDGGEGDEDEPRLTVEADARSGRRSRRRSRRVVTGRRGWPRRTAPRLRDRQPIAVPGSPARAQRTAQGTVPAPPPISIPRALATKNSVRGGGLQPELRRQRQPGWVRYDASASARFLLVSMRP